MSDEVSLPDNPLSLALVKLVTRPDTVFFDLPSTNKVTSDVLKEFFERAVAINWILFNPRDYSDLVLHHLDTGKWFEGFRAERKRDMLEQGIMGSMHGTTFVQNREAPYGEVVAICPDMATFYRLKLVRPILIPEQWREKYGDLDLGEEDL